MVTVQKVFDATINLMDEQAQGNGMTMTEDTEEYKFRTVAIINVILPTLYPYSQYYIPGHQPELLDTNKSAEEAFEQEVPIEECLAIGVLPYALAAHLVAGENEELSAWFLNRYNNAFSQIINRLPASFEQIATPYGLF